jgi:hypothetical protein
MEVHHHSHTARKKWTHYFWEFLMLFLAVFCGFLAEYQLKHVIEHQREKQFMKSMVEDLQKDLARLRTETGLVEEQHVALDSLCELIYQKKFDPPSISKLYELQQKYMRPVAMRLINRTELQLKNAGGMRLIRNRQVADSVINYWAVTELLYEQQENINSHRIKAKDVSFTIFNNKYYKDDNYAPVFTGAPELMTQNDNLLSEYANRISHMSNMLEFGYSRRLERQSKNASILIALIQEKYHLQ